MTDERIYFNRNHRRFYLVLRNTNFGAIDMSELVEKLKQLRKQEQEIRKQRLALEKIVLDEVGHEFEKGTKHYEEFTVVGDYYITVHKEQLLQLARDYKLEDKLPTLFRWKPEVELKEWKKEENHHATVILERALTRKPGNVIKFKD